MQILEPTAYEGSASAEPEVVIRGARRRQRRRWLVVSVGLLVAVLAVPIFDFGAPLEGGAVGDSTAASRSACKIFPVGLARKALRSPVASPSQLHVPTYDCVYQDVGDKKILLIVSILPNTKDSRALVNISQKWRRLAAPSSVVVDGVRGNWIWATQKEAGLGEQ